VFLELSVNRGSWVQGVGCIQPKNPNWKKSHGLKFLDVCLEGFLLRVFHDIPFSWATCPGARGWSTGSGSNRPGWYKNSFADASHYRCVRRHPTPTSPPELAARLLVQNKKRLDLAPAVAYSHSCWEVAMSFSTYVFKCCALLCDERLPAHSFSHIFSILWAAGPGTTTKDAAAPNNQATNLTTDHAGKQRSKASNKNTTSKKEMM